jgi:threonine synthase
MVTMTNKDATDVTATTDEISIADAIVDRIASRANVLMPLIEKTGGAGWIANNESIKIAQEIVKKYAGGLVISANSALSVAGLMNAVYTGRTWNGTVVCMICGN